MASDVIREALSVLGEKRVEAAVISVLMADSPATTKEIMEETGLRQPEVSMAVRALSERGWLEAQPIPREGKGRPMNEYHAQFDATMLSAYYAAAAKAAHASIDAAVGSIQSFLR